MSEFTPALIKELKSFLVERMVDNMETKDLEEYVTNDLDQYFERALSFNKPFALIMTNTWLNDSAPKQLFKEKDLQLLMFDKRMKFISPDGRDNDKITFSSSYYCYNILPKQIIMEELDVPPKKVSTKSGSMAVLPL